MLLRGVASETETFEYGEPLGHNIVDNECTVCHEKVATLTFELNDDGENYSVSGMISIGIVIIPSVHENKPVTSIGEYAFSGCSGLTSITIPDSVTSIGYWAFYECTILTKVYYKGTASDWKEISISHYNDLLTNATRYYYSEIEPKLNSDGTA